MSLYDDYAKQEGFYYSRSCGRGLPFECHELQYKISNYNDEVCLYSLVLYLKQLEDRIKELEESK